MGQKDPHTGHQSAGFSGRKRGEGQAELDLPDSPRLSVGLKGMVSVVTQASPPPGAPGRNTSNESGV